ncbi:MAG TPA: outer membrane lipoprotein carrier protein LolA [Labilithrix sp.]|nr:outer membrane lipoprotein carrier protein LolA [Labilithrix sp.]
MPTLAKILIGTMLVAVVTFPSVVARADEPGDAGHPAREERDDIEGPELDALLAKIAKARKDLRTLRAKFVQERRITLLATTVKSRGELTLMTPDRLRWDLAPPDDVVYFVAPEGLSYRTKSGAATVPASGANVARALGDLRALLTGDLATLRDRYVLSATRGAMGIEVVGAAKDKTASVKAFTLALDKSLMIPLRARLVEGKNDAVDLTFSDVVVNGPVDPARVRP